MLNSRTSFLFVVPSQSVQHQKHMAVLVSSGWASKHCTHAMVAMWRLDWPDGDVHMNPVAPGAPQKRHLRQLVQRVNSGPTKPKREHLKQSRGVPASLAQPPHPNESVAWRSKQTSHLRFLHLSQSSVPTTHKSHASSIFWSHQELSHSTVATLSQSLLQTPHFIS
jgi:hypothetical protein